MLNREVEAASAAQRVREPRQVHRTRPRAADLVLGLGFRVQVNERSMVNNRSSPARYIGPDPELPISSWLQG